MPHRGQKGQVESLFTIHFLVKAMPSMTSQRGPVAAEGQVIFLLRRNINTDFLPPSESPHTHAVPCLICSALSLISLTGGHLFSTPGYSSYQSVESDAHLDESLITCVFLEGGFVWLITPQA